MSADSKASLVYCLAVVGFILANHLHWPRAVGWFFIGAWLAIGILKIIGCFKPAPRRSYSGAVTGGKR